MENTQLSLLNALFGGKAPGDALTLGKPLSGSLSGDAQTQDTPPEFLAFLQGLLTTAPQANEESLNESAAPKEMPFLHGLTVEALKEQLGDNEPALENDVVEADVFVTAPFADPLVAAPLQQELTKPQLNPVIAQKAVSIEAPAAPATPAAPAIAAVPGAAPLEPAAPATPAAASSRAAGLESSVRADPAVNAPLIPETAAAFEAPPFAGEAPKAGAASERLAPQGAAQGLGLASAPAQSHPQPQPQAALLAADPENGETPLIEDALQPDSGDPETLLRGEPDGQRPQLKTPGLVDNPNAKAFTAMAEHDAPEALAHSAFTREEGAQPSDVERLSAMRLETAAQSGDRSMQFSPVRDQIVAAVMSRPGDAKLEVRLDPPELGRVMIGFERDGADLVRAVVTADLPDTLDLMRRNGDMLRQALEEQGLGDLDLQFADTGARDDAPEGADDNTKLFSLTEEEIATAAVAPGNNGLINGRLDRRF